MPIIIDIDRVLLEWQHRHNQRMTYTELARRANITIPTLHRMKNGDIIQPDLRKINALCKVLDCEPGDLLVRVETHAGLNVDLAELQARQNKRFIDRVKNARKDQ